MQFPLNFRIVSFSLLDPPSHIRQSDIRTDDQFRQNIYATDLIWKPTLADKGLKTLCVEATDNFLYAFIDHHLDFDINNIKIFV